MSGLNPKTDLPFADDSQTPANTESAAIRPTPGARAHELLSPNTIVRWGFYLSVFAIPFGSLYLPGTGGRIGVQRMAQLFMLLGVLSQPRVCLRLVPVALFWFLGYIVIRMLWGCWLTPEVAVSWWQSSRELLEYLPWVWVIFNVLQFPDTGRKGLWAFSLGCALCACFHVAGIGMVEVIDGRTSVFGLNPNGLGVTYATAIIALLGLWLLPPQPLGQRLLAFPMIILIGIAMARTGSRTSILLLAMGVGVLIFTGRASISMAKRFAGLAILAIVVGVILWQIPTVIERFHEINPRDIGKLNPRARMAPVLWEMFERSPLWGLGPDSYQWELTRRAMPYLFNERTLIAAHNLLLMLLVETGIIGLLFFSLGLKGALAAAWKARLKSCGPLPLALLLPFVVAGVTLCNPSNLSVFWMVVAYALGGNHVEIFDETALPVKGVEA